jgi:hypothetical protein
MKTAYRGYLICKDVFGRMWVEKDGFLIARVNNDIEAREAVDLLLDDPTAGGRAS